MRGAICWALGVWAGMLLVSSGRAADPAPGATADGWVGFSLTVGKPWGKAALNQYAVPGVARCAWSGPGAANVVVFIQEPGTAANPREMLDGSVKGMTKTFGVTASVAAVRAAGGMQAMDMVVAGKGTGGALDGKGGTDTTQHWVAVPRERDVVVVLLTCPTAEYPELAKSFDAAVASLKIDGTQTATQKAAK